MATELNILMKQFNGSDYDTLYPKTKAENVENVYNKQEVLSDATKTLFELPLEAVPDNAFSQLYQYLFGTETQEYRWFRTKTEWVVRESAEKEYKQGHQPMKSLCFSYSDSYTFGNLGKFSLKGNIKNGNQSSCSAISNKYFLYNVSFNSNDYPSTSNLSKIYLASSNFTCRIYGDEYGDGNVYYFGKFKEITSEKKTTNEIVTSSNPNAYPNSGTQDGWTYTKLPPILNKVGLITIGNYQGTGKNGVNNKNSITLQYPPKVLVVMQENGTGLGSGAGIFWVGQNKMNTNTFIVSGNTVSWYASAVGAQMNTNGIIYHYLAIC